MPFKSEKQRRYLWANEPEIARDWTKTYGSKVKKADGGRIGLKSGGRKDAEGSGYHGAQAMSARASQSQSQRDATDRAIHRAVHGTRSIPEKIKDASTNLQKKLMTNYFNKTINREEDALRRFHGIQNIEDEDNKLLNAYMSVDPLQFTKKGASRMGQINERTPSVATKTNPVGIGGALFNKFLGGGVNVNNLSQSVNKIQEANMIKNAIDKGEFSQTDFTNRLNRLNPPASGGGEGGGLPYIWPPVYTAAESAPGEEIASTGGLGEGHFRVPEQYRLAEGGRIGLSTGGIGDAMAARMVGRGAGHQTPTPEAFNFTPHQQDVMTRFQMEDIQTPRGEVEEESIEEKRFAGPDWYLERVEHLMFLGYSYEQAADIAYNTESYLEAIGSDFASGGRVGYGLGSFVKKLTKAPKKALKSIKKLAKSPLGKLAMMYAAGTYLGGTQAMGGTGQLSFAQRLKDPKLLGNLVKPQGWSWPGTDTAAKNVLKGTNVLDYEGAAAGLHDKGNLLTKGLGWLKKNPIPAIFGASTAAGLMADKPIEEVGGIDKKWGKDKAWWDAYYANMPEDGDYRVEDEYILASAEGGRVAKNQGGLMNLGGLEKDYRNTGGFVEIGGKEKADDVPARLSRNEFVITADGVRGAGDGDINLGADRLQNMMKNLEAKGKGAKDMYQTATRISEVI